MKDQNPSRIFLVLFFISLVLSLVGGVARFGGSSFFSAAFGLAACVFSVLFTGSVIVKVFKGNNSQSKKADGEKKD